MKHVKNLACMASLILGLSSCKQADTPEVIQAQTLESAVYTTNRLIWHDVATHIDTHAPHVVFNAADALNPGIGRINFWMVFDADATITAHKLDSLGASLEDAPRHAIYTLHQPLDVTLYNPKGTNRWYMMHAARIYTKDCIDAPARIEEGMQSFYNTIR